MRPFSLFSSSLLALASIAWVSCAEEDRFFELVDLVDPTIGIGDFAFADGGAHDALVGGAALSLP